MLPELPQLRVDCPYTEGRTQQSNGTDLAKARRLVKQSGTSGTKVTVYGIIRGRSDRALLADIAQALRAIGYQVSTPRSNRPAIRGSPTHGNGVQIWGKDGWLADYPSADTFYDPLISCRVRNRMAGVLQQGHRRASHGRPGHRADRSEQVPPAVEEDRQARHRSGPVGHPRQAELFFDFTSSRVGNYRAHLSTRSTTSSGSSSASIGLLLDLWRNQRPPRVPFSHAQCGSVPSRPQGLLATNSRQSPTRQGCALPHPPGTSLGARSEEVRGAYRTSADCTCATHPHAGLPGHCHQGRGKGGRFRPGLARLRRGGSPGAPPGFEGRFGAALPGAMQSLSRLDQYPLTMTRVDHPQG